MKKYLCIFFLMGFLSQYAHAATTLIITPSPTASAQCPTNTISYFVTANGGLPACTYTWIVTGGVIIGTNVGTTIGVKWNDAPGTGTLKVTASSCTPSSENGSTKTNTYTRLSVFAQNFGTLYPSTYDLPYCSNGPVTVYVEKMYVQGTGGIGQPPQKEVDRYIFSIPAGWRQSSPSIVGPAQISTTANGIVLVPVSATPATISVVGSVSNSCAGTSYSNIKTLTITRSPTFDITPPAGFTSVKCGQTGAITFNAPSLPCATSYAWTKPSNWGGSSTTNSIALTPPGTGTGSPWSLKVDVTLSTGYVLSKTISIAYSNTVPNPTVSTTSPYYEFCNYESFTMTVVPPSGYTSNFGYDWYATGGILMNGVQATIESPLHTTTTGVTVTVPGSTYGTQSCRVRMNNTTCPPSTYIGPVRRVGTYSSSEFSIIGPSAVCANQVADFRPNFITPDVTGYQWSAPSGWSNSGQGTPYFSVSVPSPFYGGAITLRLQNRCGLTNTPYVLNLYNTCFGFAASPNPVDNTLVISDLDPSQPASAALIDKSNKTLAVTDSKDGKIEMDVSQVPSGLYILMVKQQDKSDTQQIVISH